ncbi:MAG: hypothetical protein WBL74_12695 [Novosphingobium sp.]|uniref:hypothetical protein n=1 Tax=Novosphingobium sp. TaxID=1874826 RepID=UPI003C7A867A
MVAKKPDAQAEPKDGWLKLAARAEDYSAHWRDQSASLAKWILGTLVTLNTGGIFLVSSLKIHPEALSNAYRLLFFALAITLGLAALELYRLRELSDIAFDLKFGTNQSQITQEEVISRLSKTGPSAVVAIGCAGSLILTFFAGSEIVSATSPCSTADLEYSLRENDNVRPTKNGNAPCYFYKIPGLPDDPLERAKKELELLRT